MKLKNSFYCVLTEQEMQSSVLTNSDISMVCSILEKYGFVVIENLLDNMILSSLNQKMDQDYNIFKKFGKKWLGGGLKIGHLNAAPPNCGAFISREILLNQALHDITSAYFNRETVTISYTANINLPGSYRQSFHSDERDLNSDYLTISIPLCDVDEENGSIEVIPNTYFQKFSPMGVYKEAHKSVRINTKLGSAIIWLCGTWHRGTANRSTACRHMLNLRHTYPSSRTFHTADGIPMPDFYVKSLNQEKSRIKTRVSAAVLDTVFTPNYFRAGLAGWFKEEAFLTAPRLNELLYALYVRIKGE